MLQPQSAAACGKHAAVKQRGLSPVWLSNVNRGLSPVWLSKVNNGLSPVLLGNRIIKMR